jgi:hypothetical protein
MSTRKPVVKIAKKDTCVKIKTHKSERTIPSHHKEKFHETMVLAKTLGGKELAHRSLLRAEGSCMCNQCDCSRHKHDDVIKHTYGPTIHCANATLYRCDTCPKRICGLCHDKHTILCEKIYMGK